MHPYAYQLRYDAVRIVFLYSYPYGLHYTVREKEKEIILLGFFHTAQSPKKMEKAQTERMNRPNPRIGVNE